MKQRTNPNPELLQTAVNHANEVIEMQTSWVTDLIKLVAERDERIKELEAQSELRGKNGRK